VKKTKYLIASSLATLYMAIVTLKEFIDLVIMIAVVGFIFKDVFRKPITSGYDPLKYFSKNLNWENFKWAIIVTAPAIVLHEMSHKIAAISFGIPAVFHAAYFWLGIGAVLKMLNFGFIFFVPGYVSYVAGLGAPLEMALIAFAGPGMNLLLFLFATLAIKNNWLPKYNQLLHMTKQINLFLFIFNMIPFRPFDGSHVFGNLINSVI
jgi:Zn-dependent protease